MYTHTIKEPYWFVSAEEPAVDGAATLGECSASCADGSHGNDCNKRPAFDQKLYMQTGDTKYLPLKNGVQPRRWRLRHLGAKEHAYVMNLFRRAAMVGDNDPMGIAIRITELALMACENVQYEEAGKVRDLVIRHSVTADGLARVDQDTMDLLYDMDKSVVLEIADWVAKQDIEGDPT